MKKTLIALIFQSFAFLVLLMLILFLDIDIFVTDQGLEVIHYNFWFYYVMLFIYTMIISTYRTLYKQSNHAIIALESEDEREAFIMKDTAFFVFGKFSPLFFVIIFLLAILVVLIPDLFFVHSIVLLIKLILSAIASLLMVPYILYNVLILIRLNRYEN